MFFVFFLFERLTIQCQPRVQQRRTSLLFLLASLGLLVFLSAESYLLIHIGHSAARGEGCFGLHSQGCSGRSSRPGTIPLLALLDAHVPERGSGCRGGQVSPHSRRRHQCRSWGSAAGEGDARVVQRRLREHPYSCIGADFAALYLCRFPFRRP